MAPSPPEVVPTLEHCFAEVSRTFACCTLLSVECPDTSSTTRQRQSRVLQKLEKSCLTSLGSRLASLSDRLGQIIVNLTSHKQRSVISRSAPALNAFSHGFCHTSFTASSGLLEKNQPLSFVDVHHLQNSICRASRQPVRPKTVQSSVVES